MNDEISILDLLEDWSYYQNEIPTEDLKGFFEQLKVVLGEAYANGCEVASTDLLGLSKPVAEEKIRLLQLIQKLTTTEFLNGYNTTLEIKSHA